MPASDEEPLDPGGPRRGRVGLLTVPNVLCAIRLLASPLLLVLAWADMPRACLGLFVFLALTDWLDGKLAVLLQQQTAFGARLDSFADVTFYSCSVLAVLWLRWEMVGPEVVWIAAAAASYLVSVAAGLARFGRGPTYHTRMAKTSWLLAGIAVVSALAGWSVWPLRAAAAAVVLTNVEETAITFVLPRWRADVPSVYHALRIRREPAAAGGRGSGPAAG
ncbi:MAG TPA: CDP-alcohol phosphatidyltransferase family protein [Gemmataceae bacterium]